MDQLSTILGRVAAGLIPMAIFSPPYAVWAIAWPIPGTAFFIAEVARSVFLAAFSAATATLRARGESTDVSMMLTSGRV
jgi:hypothetical protein